MKSVMVTGAGGYVGSILVPKLLDRGYRVVAVDRFFFGADKLAEQTNLVKVKEDTRRLTEEHFEKIDAVIDLAAVSNDPTADQFKSATEQINGAARIRTAQLAAKCGARRYILASSASVYGHKDSPASETDATSPQTIYALANLTAEQGILPLAAHDFCVTAVRQATLYGLSPRMRFDLAVNGMTFGAWKTGKLPLMKDGNQYRPLLHLDDTTDLFITLLESQSGDINGETFNVGSNDENYRIADLGRIIADHVSKLTGKDIKIEWYGDPDTRNYLLDCSKVNSVVCWTAKRTVADGVEDIVDALQKGVIDEGDMTITLDWYRQLVHWHRIVKEVELYGGILDIDSDV